MFLFILVPGISNFYESKENDVSYFEQKEMDELRSIQSEYQSNIDNNNIRKVSCSFGFTEYGVTINKPILSKGVKRPLKEDSEEQKTKSSKNLSSSTSTSTITTSTTSGILNMSQNKKVTISMNGEKGSKWQNDLSQEEVANINAFASLNSGVLLKKLKDIHNTAFYLAIEEEKEMLKARFLNILDNHTEVNINGHSCNLGGNDFAFSESKLCQSTESCSR